MSIAAAALALGATFEHDGKKYELKPLTYEGCARFGQWMEDRSWNGMKRAADRDGQVKAWMQAHLSLVASGEFEPGSESFSKATTTEAGSRYLLQLMLQLPDEEAEDVAFEVSADDEKRMEVVGLMGRLNSDPLAVRARRTPSRK